MIDHDHIIASYAYNDVDNKLKYIIIFDGSVIPCIIILMMQN